MLNGLNGLNSPALASTRDIIVKLKKKRKELKLSYGDINALIKENGDFPLQKSTLSRIFAEGSEEGRFDYEDTIRPLANALLDSNSFEENGLKKQEIQDSILLTFAKINEFSVLINIKTDNDIHLNQNRKQN